MEDTGQQARNNFLTSRQCNNGLQCISDNATKSYLAEMGTRHCFQLATSNNVLGPLRHNDLATTCTQQPPITHHYHHHHNSIGDTRTNAFKFCALGLTQSPKIANAQICPSPNIKHKLLLLREYEKRIINKCYTYDTDILYRLSSGGDGSNNVTDFHKVT